MRRLLGSVSFVLVAVTGAAVLGALPGAGVDGATLIASKKSAAVTTTTAAPTTTTAQPTTTTTAPPVTTTVPVTTTTAPAVTTTTAPAVTTTTAAPETTTTAPATVTADATVAAPSTTTAASELLAALPSRDLCAGPATRTVNVATTTALKSALSNALPGDRIVIADGTYTGLFNVSRPGTPTQRIQLCGGPGAVLTRGTLTIGPVVYPTADYWDLVGFRVTNAASGIQSNHASNNVFDHLTVDNVGGTAIGFRNFSINNRVSFNTIHDTGKNDPQFGEGVYVGSATNHWCDYSGCLPDASNGTVVQNNTFFNMGAEAIDIKEGTTSGLAIGNVMDGAGMVTNSWVDVKGNGWIIRGNQGVNSRLDGYRTEIAGTGWGLGNVFTANTADLRGPGFGFNLKPGSIVMCDNTVLNGRTWNVACSN